MSSAAALQDAEAELDEIIPRIDSQDETIKGLQEDLEIMAEENKELETKGKEK